MTDIDLFHPANRGWEDAGNEAPEYVREQLPQLSWGKITVRQRTLPFYDGVRLLIIRGADWAPPNLLLYALQTEDEVYLLNGKSPPIHAINSKGHLDLNEDTIIPYLEFFCFFVRGDEGPFYVVGDRSAAYLPNGLRHGSVDEALAEAKRHFESRYQSPRMFGRSPDNKWRCSATIMYSNAMFVADFLIHSSGMAEMINDTPIISDLPVVISAPLVPESETGGTLH